MGPPRAVLVLLLVLAGAAPADDEPLRLSLELEDVTLETLARTVANRASVSVDVAPAVRNRSLTIRVEGRTPEEILREAARIADVPILVLADGSFRLGLRRGLSESEVRSRIAGGTVDLTTHAGSVPEMMRAVQEQIGVPILLDPESPSIRSTSINLRVQGIPAEHLLMLLGRFAGNRIGYDVRWGTVVLASPGELAKLPVELLPPATPDESREDAIARSFLETSPVAFEVTAEPLERLIDRIAKQAGIPILLAPEALEAIGSTRISWEVRDAPAGAVLGLLLSRRGLRLRLEAGKLRVEKTPDDHEER
jgi:hypothetical protein